MARTATQRRGATAGRKSSGGSTRRKSAGGSNGRKSSGGSNGAASKARKASDSVNPTNGSLTGKLARAAAKKALKAIMKGMANTGAGAVRAVSGAGAGAGRGALETALSRRLPVQVSIDVAVPLTFAWEEWMTLEWLTEGTHRIVDVEQDGDQLFGELAGPRSSEWVADIVDEREEQSFAWRSVEGSDCAGLATFHRLSDRLTRIELDLDVLPTNPAEAAVLATGIARRRATAELRRFKAHVEFINPDVYESDESDEAEEPEDEDYESDEGEEPEDEDEDEEYESDEDGQPEDED